jgi:4-amino-4-deoxy-L-arabinose transferase-like glycosyltransferase
MTTWIIAGGKNKPAVKRITLPIFLIAAIAALHWLPNLFTKGMFMDGVYDALFAHNLVRGIGGFWNPQTADYAHSEYWDNPQLSSYFLSLWYKVFGDYYWAEKLYSLFTALVQLVLIASLWRIYFSEKEETKRYAWLPCLLLLIVPLTSWCYSGNLMENTMSIFTTSSVMVFLFFLRNRKNLLLYSAIGGALIFLALLTKGPVALFPLAVPFFFIWVEENFNWKQSFAYMLIQFVVTAALFAFVFSMDAPKNFLQHYLDVQLLPVLTQQSSPGGSHFTILIQLLATLSPLFVLSALALFISKKESTSDKSLLKTALVFIVIGLSASAPIMLSAKQNKHYLLPSLPLFAVGFASLILPFVKWLEGKFSNEKLVQVSKLGCVLVIALCIFLSVKNIGTYSRDEVLLTDIEKIQALVKSEKVIRTDWSLYSDWALRVNLNRHYDKKICMPDETAPTSFYLTKAKERGDKLPATATRIYEGKMYDLYLY